MNELMVFERNEQAVVSSRVIADRFGKRHDNVIRDIKNLVSGLLKIEETPKGLFIESFYTDNQNFQVYSEYLCTKQGFCLLAMGFTGDKALEWKFKYVEAFEKMEQIIRGRQSSEWFSPESRARCYAVVKQMQLHN